MSDYIEPPSIPEGMTIAEYRRLRRVEFVRRTLWWCIIHRLGR